MSMEWLKLHHDIIHDIKLRRFSPQEKWAWVVLLVLASEGSDRGVITADDEDIADVCEFNSTQDWLYFRDKLISKGLAEPSIGGLKIVNWEKRQYAKPSDKPEASKERKRRQRAKAKEIAEQLSRDVTPLSRHRSDPDPDQIQIREEILDAHEETPPPVIEREIESQIESVSQHPENLSSLANSKLDSAQPIVEDGFSAAAKPQKFEIEASFWDVYNAPWHTSVSEFKDSMLQAIYESDRRYWATDTGKRDDLHIKARLRKLEASATNNFGSSTINARSELLDYWKEAERIEQRRSQLLSQPTPAEHKPDPTPEQLAEGLAIFKRIRREARNAV